MLSLFKPTLSRRWLIFILLAVLLPLCLFGWWSMESINTLLNSEARRTLNANGHLLQMMIEQRWIDDWKMLATRYRGNPTVHDALVAAGLAKSKSEARTFIQGGSVAINGAKADAIDHQIAGEERLFGRFTILRRGKKNYGLVSWQ